MAFVLWILFCILNGISILTSVGILDGLDILDGILDDLVLLDGILVGLFV